MSNGVRLVSAIAAVKNRMAPSGCVTMPQCDRVRPLRAARSPAARACRRRGRRRGRPGPSSLRTTSSATRRAGRRAATTCCTRPSRRASCRRRRARRWRSRREADVEPRHLQRRPSSLQAALVSVTTCRAGPGRRRAERHDGEGDEHRDDGHQRREREEEAVGLRRDEVLLHDHLHRVGDEVRDAPAAPAEDARRGWGRCGPASSPTACAPSRSSSDAIGITTSRISSASLMSAWNHGSIAQAPQECEPIHGSSEADDADERRRHAGEGDRGNQEEQDQAHSRSASRCGEAQLDRQRLASEAGAGELRHRVSSSRRTAPWRVGAPSVDAEPLGARARSARGAGAPRPAARRRRGCAAPCP